jgi:hypothetical protein
MVYASDSDITDDELADMIQHETRINSIVFIRNCPRITRIHELPTGVSAVLIFNCESFRHLPDRMDTVDTLVLRWLPMIEELPDDMVSLLKLDIETCPRITHIPEGLINLIDLNVLHCPLITEFPETGLTRIERLKINDTPITTIPYHIDPRRLVFSGPMRLISSGRNFESGSRIIGGQHYRNLRSNRIERGVASRMLSARSRNMWYNMPDDVVYQLIEILTGARRPTI